MSYQSQLPWIELFEAISRYRGADVYEGLLESWPGGHRGEVEWLSDFRRRAGDGVGDAADEDLCRLYAISRVATQLLLRFQSGRADGTDYPGPEILVEGYQLFFESLGFHVPEAKEFHPFFHEVVTVEGVDRIVPVQVTARNWPPLMLGNMMFARGGVAISASTTDVVKEIAERSKMYWANRRKNRPCEDQSHGWGSNSQWRTALRRDYRLANGYCYNIDAEVSLNDPDADVWDLDRDTMIELVRHRCLVRAADNDVDLYPYRYSYLERTSADAGSMS